MLDKIENIPEISLSRRMKDRDDTIETVNHSNRVSTNLEAMKRVILLGDAQVGKTSIVKRIVVTRHLIQSLTQTLFRKSNSTKSTI